MNIFLLTSVYPSKSSPKGTTPVVHYFTKEWVASGHRVHVFHFSPIFPKFYYCIGRIFGKFLSSRLGHVIPQIPPINYDEEVDGVLVTHMGLSKLVPYGRYKKKTIISAFKCVEKYVENEGVPTIFVGHWDNPQLELLDLLKKRFIRPSCIVFHSNHFSYLEARYKEETRSLLENVDLIGFRNITAKEEYEGLYGAPKHSFIAASGVSMAFIEAGNAFERHFNKDVKNYIFVGALMGRKHPAAIVEALSMSYGSNPFNLTYIGEGREKNQVLKIYSKRRCNGNLNFTGRINRQEIITHLKMSDVFIMISEDEIFGLVYLEAMALGCITIASKHEGIDGIIEDGVNGFLCDAGNATALASVISKINRMTDDELNLMSIRAKSTAHRYTDKLVAENYINSLKWI